jgi:tetratricopeptide (TPR) repeat protein
LRKKMLKYALMSIALVLSLGALAFLFLNDSVAQKLNKAIEMRDDGDPEEAANLFGKIALMYPQSEHADDALFEQGFTYLIKVAPKVDESEKAVYLTLAGNAFNSLIQNYDESDLVGQSLIYMAQIKSDMREFDEAIDYYQRAVEKMANPEDIQRIYFEMFRNYESLGQSQQAIEKLRQIIDIGNESVYLENSYLTLAGYYRMVARDQPAESVDAYGAMIALLQTMLEKSGISTASRRDALLLVAEAYFELDRYDQCETALTLVEDLESKDESFSLEETDMLAIEGYRKRIALHLQMGK